MGSIFGCISAWLLGTEAEVNESENLGVDALLDWVLGYERPAATAQLGVVVCGFQVCAFGCLVVAAHNAADAASLLGTGESSLLL